MDRTNSLELGKTYHVNSFSLPDSKVAEWTLAELKKEGLFVKGILINQCNSCGRPQERIDFMEGFFRDIYNDPIVITLDGTQEFKTLFREDERYDEFKNFLDKHSKWNKPPVNYPLQ